MDKGNGETIRRTKRASDDGSSQQPTKRSRVSRACDQCRASRERCDGVQPSCRTCCSLQRSCSYLAQPKKRGIQPNYIRTLEVTLGWIFQQYPEAERKLSKELPNDNSNARCIISGDDPGVTEELHLSWRQCLVNKQIEQLLSGAQMDENGPLISESVLPASSTSDDIVDAPTSYRSPSLSTPVEQDPPQHDVGYADLMDVSTSLIDMQPTKVDTITTNHRLPHNASALLELYFAFTHSWLPMTEKHSILRVMYSYPPSGLSREQSNSAEHAELWSIMALAATQLGDNDASSGDLGQIRQHADSLLPAGNAPYEVPHIRALLLRALDDFQRDQILSAWLRVGSVLLANIGQTARRCCHVQLAAFVIETALACRLRTVGHFTTDYIRRVGFVDEDGMDEWEPWSDPLNISSGHPVAKAPTKAFSTLNELVRFHLRMVDTKYAGDGLDCATISGLNDPVVSALLRNASTQQRRILPFDLTMAFCKNMEGKTLNWTSDARPDLNPTWTLPDANPADPQDVTSQSASERGHAFMTIPNDSSQTGLDLAQTGLGMLWPTFQSPVQLSNTLSGAKNASSDIFDELSTLERQESSHNPHFMHNLGFPDLDLAEFFGAGYLPTET